MPDATYHALHNRKLPVFLSVPAVRTAPIYNHLYADVHSSAFFLSLARYLSRL